MMNWMTEEEKKTITREKHTGRVTQGHTNQWNKSVILYSCHGSTSTALIHISCVLKRSDTRKNNATFSHIIWIHISCVIKLSETCLNVYGSLRTASLHISCVLRWSGTNSNEYGSMRIASSHISCILRCPGISFIHPGTFANKVISLFVVLRLPASIGTRTEKNE